MELEVQNPEDYSSLPWFKIEPPIWWDAVGANVIADRHLPCGTRQHMVRGSMKKGLVVHNAQVVGENDLQSIVYSDVLSHLSKA